MLGPWILLALNGISVQHSATCAELCWDVSPHICITEQQQQSCHATLQLRWRSVAPKNLCLYLAGQQLQCWHDSTAGQWQQPLEWQNALLTLRDAEDQVLLQTELQVLSRKPARRRLNSPWSIF
ncbi:DUF3019 domain-containing protein [Rheinheimera gaetbuli]|jgi:hypothetical protein